MIAGTPVPTDSLHREAFVRDILPAKKGKKDLRGAVLRVIGLGMAGGFEASEGDAVRAALGLDLQRSGRAWEWVSELTTCLEIPSV